MTALTSHLEAMYKRILNLPPVHVPGELRIVISELMATPVWASILAFLEQHVAETELEAWRVGIASTGAFAWPDEHPSTRAAISWELVKRLASSEKPVSIAALARELKVRSQARDQASSRNVIELLVHPVFLFLSRVISDQADLLYELDRFRSKVEWFLRDDLYAAYNGNPRRGEFVYDRALRWFLFDRGYDFGGSQQASPSGRVDVLVPGRTLGLVPVEIKLIKGSAAVFPRALDQLRRYCDDYESAVGCLVMVVMTEREIARDLQRDAAGREYVDRDNTRLYVYFVRGVPAVSSASRSKLATPLRLTADT